MIKIIFDKNNKVVSIQFLIHLLTALNCSNKNKFANRQPESKFLQHIWEKHY